MIQFMSKIRVDNIPQVVKLPSVKLIKYKLEDQNESVILKYCGIIPYAVYDSSIYLLLGKEIEILGWESSNKWSDFGGSPDENDYNDSKTSQVTDTILLSLDEMISASSREAYEETMGFIGTQAEIIEKIKKKGRILILNDSGAFICLLPIEYDINMPHYFNACYSYFTRCTMEHPHLQYKYVLSCPKGYMEKCEMRWVSLSEIKNVISVYKKDDASEQIYRKSFLKSISTIIDMNLTEFMI